VVNTQKHAKINAEEKRLRWMVKIC
jgi:hypothetical protein